MNTAIETIGTAQVLKDAGVEPVQADAIAKVVVAQREDLATKADVAVLKSDIAVLKSDISSLRTELKSEIDSLRNVLESKIGNLRWTMVVVGGIIVALVKFLP